MNDSLNLVNRVAESDIDVFDLESLWDEAPVVEFDLHPFLHRGLILKEKPFREAVRAWDWAQYHGAHVAVYCSTDAIIPVWAYMLVASRLDGIARSVAHGRAPDLIRDHFVRRLEAADWSRFAGRIVVVKGCASRIVPLTAYLRAVQKLQAVARKLMYGEPCSSVPIWRAPSAAAPPAGAPPAPLPSSGASAPARP